MTEDAYWLWQEVKDKFTVTGDDKCPYCFGNRFSIVYSTIITEVITHVTGPFTLERPSQPKIEHVACLQCGGFLPENKYAPPFYFMVSFDECANPFMYVFRGEHPLDATSALTQKLELEHNYLLDHVAQAVLLHDGKYGDDGVQIRMLAGNAEELE